MLKVDCWNQFYSFSVGVWVVETLLRFIHKFWSMILKVGIDFVTIFITKNCLFLYIFCFIKIELERLSSDYQQTIKQSSQIILFFFSSVCDIIFCSYRCCWKLFSLWKLITLNKWKIFKRPWSHLSFVH